MVGIEVDKIVTTLGFLLCCFILRKAWAYWDVRVCKDQKNRREKPDAFEILLLPFSGKARKDCSKSKAEAEGHL